ncbi:Na+/H+ antiporter NhaC family protein [Halovivax gelatinilyticus]|uniref:Na+/H+ antiporter NhaC family protein n=1 Tax=Halovivax gelatinilyticus TaxID=2961597 RepID=UPI0020CA88F0|nr:Na+/H+ antiporter NhaC family protein [Halovivax gelatinilyticus]
MSEFGMLSVIPPLLAIVLAIVTRKAVLSLFLGIWSGAIIYAGGPDPLGDPIGWIEGVLADGFGFFTTFDWIVEAISDPFHTQILIFTLLLGSGVAMIWQLGGAYAVRDWALQRLDTQRKGMIATWVLGMVMFFDDYANTAIVGSSMKDVSDQLQISREKLSYVVDSTAAPVATIMLSSWVAFQISLIGDAYEELGLDGAGDPSEVEIFIQSIPFNMYAILAIVMVGIIVISRRDYGEMLDAEHRSWGTGKVYREDAQPMQDVEADLGEPYADNPRLGSFFYPVIVLIAVTVITALWTGYYEAGSPPLAELASWSEMVQNADYAAALIYGSFAMVVTGFVLGSVYDIFDFREATDTTISGFGIMLTAVTILVLAWGIGSTVGALETGEYVSGAIGDDLPTALLPVIVLGTAAFIAFSTGTSWGTMGILTPIVIPISWAMTGDHTMTAAVVGMIFSGAIFGDHSSPISDTSVLSSTFTGADLIDHVRTQLYYAVTVALVAALLITIWGVTEISPFILLPIGALILIGLVYGLSELDARRKGVDPIAVNGGRHRGDPVKPATEADRTEPTTDVDDRSDSETRPPSDED